MIAYYADTIPIAIPVLTNSALLLGGKGHHIRYRRMPLFNTNKQEVSDFRCYSVENSHDGEDPMTYVVQDLRRHNSNIPEYQTRAFNSTVFARLLVLDETDRNNKRKLDLRWFPEDEQHKIRFGMPWKFKDLLKTQYFWEY